MGCCECCRLPNGALVVAPALLGTLATLLSAASLFSCRWFIVRQTFGDCDASNNNDCFGRLAGRGFVFLETFSSATSSGDWFQSCAIRPAQDFHDFDNSTNSYWSDNRRSLGLYFNGSAVLVGLFITVASWVGWCRPYRKCGWAVIAAFYLACFMMQAASLTYLASDECKEGGYYFYDDNNAINTNTNTNTNADATGGGCLVGEGAIFDMIAAVLWVLCAMCCSSLPMADSRSVAAATPAAKKRGRQSNNNDDIDEERQSATDANAAAAVAAVTGGGRGSMTTTPPPPQLTLVRIRETMLPDGSKKIERRTTKPNGRVHVLTEISTTTSDGGPSSSSSFPRKSNSNNGESTPRVGSFRDEEDVVAAGRKMLALSDDDDEDSLSGSDSSSSGSLSSGDGLIGSTNSAFHSPASSPAPQASSDWNSGGSARSVDGGKSFEKKSSKGSESNSIYTNNIDSNGRGGTSEKKTGKNSYVNSDDDGGNSGGMDTGGDFGDGYKEIKATPIV